MALCAQVASSENVALVRGRSLGRQFGWLWAAYAVSTFGTWLAFDALPLIAILALHVRPEQVSLLAAAGLAVGALVALPLGPWVEYRRKRRVMIAMDLTRFAALVSIPATYAVGWLTFGQLVAVAVVVAAADITFRAASGACLKNLVKPDDVLTANARFESTTWTATLVGPPLGGAAIGLFGPVTTVVADAVSYVLSAAGLHRIKTDELPPRRPARFQARELFEGWRYIARHRLLRKLFLNTALVNALILATAPLLAVLMLGELGMAPWQYGLAFAAPCAGGLIGSRLATRVSRRLGEHRVLRVSGTLRACWSIGLAFVPAGWAGVVFVMVIQFGLVTSVGFFNPAFATIRLEQTPIERLARTLSAWSVTTKATVAASTAAWGLLAAAVGVRAAIAIAGGLMLVTPVLLPWRSASPAPEASPVQEVPPAREASPLADDADGAAVAAVPQH